MPICRSLRLTESADVDFAYFVALAHDVETGSGGFCYTDTLDCIEFRGCCGIKFYIIDTGLNVLVGEAILVVDTIVVEYKVAGLRIAIATVKDNHGVGELFVGSEREVVKGLATVVDGFGKAFAGPCTGERATLLMVIVP